MSVYSIFLVAVSLAKGKKSRKLFSKRKNESFINIEQSPLNYFAEKNTHLFKTRKVILLIPLSVSSSLLR